MDCVSIEKEEGLVRIQVHYSAETKEVAICAIFMALMIPVPVWLSLTDLYLNPTKAVQEGLISLVFTAVVGGLLFFRWIWKSALRTIIVSPKDGVVGIEDARRFIKVRRILEIKEIKDIIIVIDNAGKKWGDTAKYFLYMISKSGKHIKLTKPDANITRNDVDAMYAVLRPLVLIP